MRRAGSDVTLPFIDPLELGDWSYPLTLVGIVAVMNVVNFTERADGLAAGVCTIAAATFAVIALSLDRDDAGVLAALTAGAAVGFLWHNFHRPRSSWATPGQPARLAARVRGDTGRVEDRRRRRAVLPAADPRRAALDATFVVASGCIRRPVYRPTAGTSTTASPTSASRSGGTVLYLYGWTLSLAALALAMRFVPYSDDDGTLHVGWTLVIVGFALVAVAASFYLVIVLAILEFSRFRARELRRQVETGEIAALCESEIEDEIEREVETGEFEAVGGLARPPARAGEFKVTQRD